MPLPTSPNQPTARRRGPTAGFDRARTMWLVGLAAFATLGMTGCGRSAPVDALTEVGSDPEIAGVSVTSPDAVVALEETSAEETVSTTTAPVQAAVTYVVQPGDTLSGIAGSYEVSIDALAQANGITDVNSIAPGQELVIPARPVEVDVVDTESTETTQP